MRLVVPTDFQILRELSDGRRDNAVNLAVKLDQDRSYLNTRLPVLEDYALLEKVGPSPNSGLYVITERGRTALKLQDQYRDVDDFEALLEAQLQSTESSDTNSG